MVNVVPRARPTPMVSGPDHPVSRQFPLEPIYTDIDLSVAGFITLILGESVESIDTLTGLSTDYMAAEKLEAEPVFKLGD